ncbi:MAG: hypothetical protein V4737_14370 [Curtobacterium sp.]
MKRSQILAARVLVRLAAKDGEQVDDEVRKVAAMPLDSPPRSEDAEPSEPAPSSQWEPVRHEPDPTDLDRFVSAVRLGLRNQHYVDRIRETQGLSAAEAARQRVRPFSELRGFTYLPALPSEEPDASPKTPIRRYGVRGDDGKLYDVIDFDGSPDEAKRHIESLGYATAVPLEFEDVDADAVGDEEADSRPPRRPRT